MIQIIYLLLAAQFVQCCQNEQSGCSGELSRFEFEVFGKVQGVYFRKYTQLKAQELDLVGWVQNTQQGTVIGVAEGVRTNELMDWLRHVGSPKSKIKRVEIKNKKNVNELEFDTFDIIK